MGYYPNEVLHDLEKGKEYTERQLQIFVITNSNVVVLSETCSVLDNIINSQKKHFVKDIIKGFEHRRETYNNYLIPNGQSTIYIID